MEEWNYGKLPSRPHWPCYEMQVRNGGGDTNWREASTPIACHRRPPVEPCFAPERFLLGRVVQTIPFSGSSCRQTHHRYRRCLHRRNRFLPLQPGACPTSIDLVPTVMPPSRLLARPARDSHSLESSHPISLRQHQR